MLSAFHIQNFRPWAFPPLTQTPSPTQSAPPTRLPLHKQHPPSNYPRSHSPCNKSSVLKHCDEPQPRTLPLPKHPLPARPPENACVNTSAKGSSYTFSGPKLPLRQSPIPSSDSLSYPRHPEKPERSLGDREGDISDSVILWDSQDATNSLTDVPDLQVITSSPSTLNSEHSPPSFDVHNDIPVDPVILADDRPWMIGELQSMHPENHLIDSETKFLYPDPPVALCDTSVYHSDSNTQAERQDSDLRSVSPHGRGHTRTPYDNAEANVPSRDSPPESSTSSQRSKLRKRKPQPSGKQPSKRARHPISGPEEETSSSALCTHYLSASADEQLQFLSWLFQGATRRTFVELGPEMLTGKGEKPAGEMDPPSSRLEHRGTSRRGKKWSSDEVAFLQELRSDKSKSWSEVTRLFSIRYPGRSRGSIQVFWSTKQGT